MGFGAAEVAQLIARLTLQDNFSKPLGKIQGNTARAGASMGKTGKAIGAAIGLGVAIIGKSVKSGLDSLAELESATTSVDGAIKTMGLTGQVTSQQIAGWANEIEHDIEAAFDDKEITQAATTLIRFGKVSTSSLKPALTVIADLATKTGSVESAASLLARSLAAPEKAAGKLAKVGVILTKSQEDQIKAMVEAGDVAGAQALLLDALAKSTEGAAKAMNGPMVDAQLILRDVTEEAQKALATGFIPVLTEVRTLLTEELGKQSTLDNIKAFGEGLAGGLKGLIGVARGLPWNEIGNSLKLAAAGGKALLDALLGLPPWIQTAVLTGWGLNKLTGGALTSLLGSGLEVVFKQFAGRGSTPANPLFVSDVLGGKGGLPGGAAGGAAAGGGALAGILGTAGILAGFAAIAESASKVPDAFSNFTTGMNALSNNDVPAARDALQDLVAGMPALNPLVSGTGLIQVALDHWPSDPLPIDPRNLSEGNRELVDKVDNARNATETMRIELNTRLGEQRGTMVEQKAATDRARDAIEASRIATVSAVDASKTAVTGKVALARDSIEASRIALSTKLGETRTAVDASSTAITGKISLARDAIESSRIAAASQATTTQTAINLARDRIEAGRIATVTGATNTQTAINQARDRIEAARIAQVSATTTSATTIANRGSADAQAIVSAIRNKDFSVRVSFVDKGDSGNRPAVRVETGGNVVRATTDARANGSGGLGGT